MAEQYAVTEKAMRPASDARACFYCYQPIGQMHKEDCVLVLKRVRVRMTVEYDIEVPASWDKELIEFARNDSSWCADNALKELAEAFHPGCMCGSTVFEYMQDQTDSYLKED